jgi:hypothetical protein
MQALAALGLQVHITEMDVRLPVDSSGNAFGGGSADSGADLPDHHDGVPAAAQLHGVSSLGRLLQRFLDSQRLPRVWRSAAVRF